MNSQDDFVVVPKELVNMIIRDEGFRDKLYIDSLGYKTIGIGFCLDEIKMPRSVANHWCKILLTNRIKKIKENNYFSPIYTKQTKARQFALINMMYQMGEQGLFEFRRMWTALDKLDFELAAQEALDSVWAKQTPDRAERIAEVIRTGEMTPYS